MDGDQDYYIDITILHELLQSISKHTTLFDQTNLFRDTVWANLQWKSSLHITYYIDTYIVYFIHYEIVENVMVDGWIFICDTIKQHLV